MSRHATVVQMGRQACPVLGASGHPPPEACFVQQLFVHLTERRPRWHTSYPDVCVLALVHLQRAALSDRNVARSGLGASRPGRQPAAPSLGTLTCSPHTARRTAALRPVPRYEMYHCIPILRKDPRTVLAGLIPAPREAMATRN